MISLPDEEGFRLDDYPLYNLNRASATYTQTMADALHAVGLEQTQWRVLGILGDQSPSTVTHIARRSVIKASTVSRMLERMERDGHIVRTPSKTDQRVVQVSITRSGQAVLDRARRISANIYRTAFANISAKDAEVLMKTLKKIRDNLARHPHCDGA